MDAREYVVLTNSASKRALFPSSLLTKYNRSDDEDSLGHMSPLKSSSPDRYSSPRQSPCWSEDSPKIPERVAHESDTISKLDILQAAYNFRSALSEVTPQKTFTEIIGDTPEKESTSDMLTPFKCLIQRQNIKETPDSTVSKSPEVIRKLAWKKKEQVARSPKKSDDTERKNFNFDSSIVNLFKNSFYRPVNSRAKTALFPESMIMKIPAASVVPKVHPRRHLNTSSFNSHRHTLKRPRIMLGEINAGVRHRVKKPKLKVKRSSETAIKSMEKPLISPEDRLQMSVVDNNLLDEYGNTPVKKSRLDEAHKTSNNESCEALVLTDVDVTPDPNKKFFKTNRTMAIDHKATVTVANNVKIKVHNGKLALGKSPMKKKPMKKRPVLENMFEEESAGAIDTSAVQEKVQEVLQKLDNEIELSALPDDSHHIQSITSSTSSLAIYDSETVNAYDPGNISKDQNPENTVEMMQTGESVSVQNTENQLPEDIASDDGTPDGSAKLYPVFYKRKGLHDSTNTAVKRASPHIKKIRLIGEDQYQIDAGQSRFRAVHCKECGTLYHVGDPEDEIAHYNIHNNISTFRFAGWKNEHVIKAYSNGERVIVVYPDDPKIWVNKAKDALSVVDKEMGFMNGYAMEMGRNKVYLYIMKNRIIGVLAAEPKEEAYRMINTGIEGPDCCSEETYPVICGVSRIWTASDQRRKGVATKLVDSLRLNFMFDHILDKKEIAFSVPTDQGKAFATNYMRTPEFMVYYK